MDEKWIRGLERLADANSRANRERLRRLTVEEAYERFEELCSAVQSAFEDILIDVGRPPAPRTHPVGLIKYWKVQ